MADGSSLYGSTKQLIMSSSDFAETGGVANPKCGKTGMLNRQRSCTSFDLSAKKIDQVSRVSVSSPLIAILKSFLSHLFFHST